MGSTSVEEDLSMSAPEPDYGPAFPAASGFLRKLPVSSCARRSDMSAGLLKQPDIALFLKITILSVVGQTGKNPAGSIYLFYLCFAYYLNHSGHSE